MRRLDPDNGLVNTNASKQVILYVVGFPLYIMKHVISEPNKLTLPSSKAKTCIFLYSIFERVALCFGSEVTLLSLP